MISIGDDNMIENGRELCKIQEHMLRAKDSMEIEDPGGAGRSVRTDITTMPVAIGHILPAEYLLVVAGAAPLEEKRRSGRSAATLHAGDKADRRTRVGTFGAPAI